MMDGRVGAIRAALDAEGHEDTAIMAYSAKYASAFYGPFREAAGSAPGFGDRRGYQMDPANGREAVREALLDVAEGADMVMVKPAAAYLDVIAGVRAATSLPLAAYHVSGEYAMLKAAAERGWLDERRPPPETLTGDRRAGADLLITYFAEDAARWIAEEGRMSTTTPERIHHKPDEADRELLNQLQAGLAFVREPYAEIGVAHRHGRGGGAAPPRPPEGRRRSCASSRRSSTPARWATRAAWSPRGTPRTACSRPPASSAATRA